MVETDDNSSKATGTGAAPVSDEQVLSTLNADGSRRWLRPRVSRGRFLNARRSVAYVLIVIFTLVPHLRIDGRPVLLLDVLKRRFTIFGMTFLPTDTALLAPLMLAVVLIVFFVTALFGRVWCGWACPQTVYMEFLFRPIERFFDGTPGKKQRIRKAAGMRKILKHATFAACSLFLAHTFLAYFVPPAQLMEWVTRSPVQHPTAFLVMVGTIGLMAFDFGYFREQTCLIACPYGRFQAAMLDRHSLIVAYDERRGEPRGKKRRKRKAREINLPVIDDTGGDCIDCKMCITTCPTGIDIRDGLQMECIGCAQCIDACDAVMDKIKRPRGLIRYSSLATVSGERQHIIRARTIVYPAITFIFMAIFAMMLTSQASAEAAILPRQGSPYYVLDSGEIANQVRMRLVNRGDTAATYDISIVDPSVRIDMEEATITLEPAESLTIGFVIVTPANKLGPRGTLDVELLASGSDGFKKTLRYHMLGPVHRSSQ